MDDISWYDLRYYDLFLPEFISTRVRNRTQSVRESLRRPVRIVDCISQAPFRAHLLLPIPRRSLHLRVQPLLRTSSGPVSFASY